MRKHSGLVVMWLSVGSFIACGGVAHSLGGQDVKQEETGNGGSSGASATGGASAVDSGIVSTGGETSSAGGTTSTGTGGTTSSSTGGVSAGACGQCEDVIVAGTRFQGCCVNDTTCGVLTDNATAYAHSSDYTRGVPSGCQPRDQVGVADTTCTSQSAPFVDLKGCCRPDGACGVDLGVLHLGCVHTVVLSAQPLQDGGFAPPIQSTTPSPDTCHYSPPVPDDAG